MNGELQVLVDGLAKRLGRSVLIGDRHFRLITHSSVDGEIDLVRFRSIVERAGPPEAIQWVLSLGVDKAEGPLRLPSNEGVAMRSRVCVPLRYAGAHLGYLWLIDDDGSLGDADLVETIHVADGAAEVLFRSAARRTQEHTEEAQALRALIGSDSVERSNALTALGELGQFRSGEGIIIVMVEPLEQAGEEIIDVLDEVAAGVVAPADHLTAEIDSRGVLLVTASALGAEDGGIVGFANAALALARKTLGESVIGISGEYNEPSRANVAYDEALQAVRVARQVPSLGGVALWSDLGAYRALVRLPVDHRGMIEPGIRRLMSEPGGKELTELLGVYLNSACDAANAALTLKVHRSNLYRRLRRIEEITGLDLDRGEDRLSAHLSLKLVELGAS